MGTKEKNILVEKADEILRFLNPKEDKIQATKLDQSIISRATGQAKQLFDNKNGGFNTAPKFPQASTLDLLLDIRDRYYNLPVILCTAYDTFKEDPRSIAADYYVIKSFDLTELKTKIKRAIDTCLPIHMAETQNGVPSGTI